MNSLLDRLAPGRSARINLVVDLVVLVAAVLIAVPLSGQHVSHSNLWLAAIGCCVLVFAVATVLAVLGAVLPPVLRPKAIWFVEICGPAIIALRLLLFRRIAT